MITALASYCKARPGVVLATFGDGHYLRYHTDCQVIANNMIMTPQHLERIALTETLLDLTPHALRSNYPWINYVYVWQSDSAPRPLVAALTGGERPDGFVLLAETAFDHPDGKRVIFARAWRIVEEEKDPPGD